MYLDQTDPQVINLTVPTPVLSDLFSASSGLYPIPGSPGYAHWVEKSYIEKSSIEFNINGKVNLFKHIIQADGFSKILISPNLKNVCVETGTSGYYGYSVVDLSTSKTYASGPEYSHCIRWLDYHRIVLQEAEYNFSTDSPHFYLYDLLTNNKELLLISPSDVKGNFED